MAFLCPLEIANFIHGQGCGGLGLRIEALRTSGHAGRDTIEQLIKMVNPSEIIPVHTDMPECIEHSRQVAGGGFCTENGWEKTGQDEVRLCFVLASRTGWCYNSDNILHKIILAVPPRLFDLGSV